MKILILLLLMTSVCWADLKFGKSTTFANDEIINKEEINKTYKISCHDGYRLDYVITDRTMDSRCRNPNVVCLPFYKATDAEIKCIKD